MPRPANEHLHGSLDVLVLKTLSWGPMHGYGITDWIERHSRDELEVIDAALYKALHRLESVGAVTATWGVSENNRKAKYYALTAKGRRMLQAEIATWQRYVSAVSGVLETP